MAETVFGYETIGEAIATRISARSFADGNPMVLHESRQIPSGRTINVMFDGRGDQDIQIAAMAGGQQKAVRAEFVIDVYQSSVDATEAARLRNRMLDEIEVQLMGDRTLGGAVAHLELGDIVLVDDERERAFWSMATLRVFCDKTLTTQ